MMPAAAACQRLAADTRCGSLLPLHAMLLQCGLQAPSRGEKPSLSWDVGRAWWSPADRRPQSVQSLAQALAPWVVPGSDRQTPSKHSSSRDARPQPHSLSPRSDSPEKTTRALMPALGPFHGFHSPPRTVTPRWSLLESADSAAALAPAKAVMALGRRRRRGREQAKRIFSKPSGERATPRGTRIGD